MPRLSIIICTLNREDVLCNTLRSVVALTKNRQDTELIVVDQTKSHTSETEACLAGLKDSIDLQRVEFASLTRARNYGIRQSSGEFILFLDDDIDPSPGLLDAHLACYEEPDVWSVGGCTLLPGQVRKSESHFTADDLKGLGDKSIARFDIDWARDMRWAPGCNMSFRRSALYQVGGFDERFRGSAIGEEADLGYRIRQAGGRIRYAPQALVYHLIYADGGCRSESEGYHKIYRHIDNTWYYWRRIQLPLSQRCAQLFKLVRHSSVNRKNLVNGRWLPSLLRHLTAVFSVVFFADRKPRLGLAGESPAGTDFGNSPK